MAADPAGRGPSGRAMGMALVVELGRSTGAAAVAAGLAVARARALADDRWVLLAELDRRGGNLLGKLVLGETPRLNADREARTGARELVERLVSAELSVGPAGRRSPELAPFLVSLAGLPGLQVLLGDPLVDGAARAAGVLTAARVRSLAARAGAEAAIIDGGPWTSAEPERQAGVDLVYAVVQARSAAENSRGLAEVAALWRHLQASDPSARLVVVVVEPEWPAEEVRRLYEQHAVEGDSRDGYRVVALGRRQDRRLLAQLDSGGWRTISNRSLAPFVTLASPIGDRPHVRSGRPPMPALPVVDLDAHEHAYLLPPSIASDPESGGSQEPQAVACAAADAPNERSCPVVVSAPTEGASDLDVRADAAAAEIGAFPDPWLWPFGDGGDVEGSRPIERPGPPGVEIGSAPLHRPAVAGVGGGAARRSPAVVAAMRARQPGPGGNGAAPAEPADPPADTSDGEVT